MEEDNLYRKQDEIIRSRFESAEEVPSNDVWKKLEANLDESKKKRGFMFWFSFITLVFLTIGGIFYYANPESSQKNISKNEESPRENIVENGSDTENPNASKGTNEKNILQASVNDQNDVDTFETESKNINSAVSYGNAKKLNKSKRNVKEAKAINNSKAIKSVVPINTLGGNKNIIESTLQVKNESKSNKKESEIENKSNLETENKKINPRVDSISTNVEVKKNEIAANIPQKETKSDSDSILETSKKADTITKNNSIVKDTVQPLKPITVLQDSIKPKLNFESFSNSISIYFSPDYYKNIIKDNSGQSIGDEIQTMRFSAGIKYSRTLLDKLAIRVGVSYSEIQHRFEEHKVIFGRFITEPFTFNSSFGQMNVEPEVMLEDYNPPMPLFPTEFSLKYNYSQKIQFMSIPIEAKINFKVKRFVFSVFTGINSQYIVRQFAKLNLLKEHLTNTLTYTDLNLNKFSFAGTFGLGLEYRLLNKLSLFIEPNGRINFTQISKDKLVKSNPYIFGGNFGVSFHF